MIRYGREQSKKLTLLRSGLTGDRNTRGVDVENPEDEGGENGFEEHDNGEWGGMTRAPGLKVLEVGERSWVGLCCVVADETRGCTSTLL